MAHAIAVLSHAYHHPSSPIKLELGKLHGSSSIPTTRREAPSNGGTELETAVRSLEGCTWKGRTREDLQARYTSLVSLCIANRALAEGNRLRSHMARNGFEAGVFLDNQFINLFAKCGDVDQARELFDHMPQRNVVSWNALISCYCSNDRPLEALGLLRDMILAGQSPNYITILTALQATVTISSRSLGEQIHSRLIKTGLFSRVEVSNALINMYSELGSPEEAEVVYNSMAERNEASWNSLISLHVRIRSSYRALALFVEMQEAGVAPDEYTYASLLALRDLNIVKELHGQISKRGICDNVFIGTTLLDAYARCGNILTACLVFDLMPQRNIVAWNSVISACLSSCMFHKGIQLFLQMGMDGIVPDKYTIAILLKEIAVNQLPTIIDGKQLHGLAFKMGLDRDALVDNSLITLYAKHSGVSDSWRIFNNISKPDLVSWNSIIQSYVHNDEPEQALKLFTEMMYSRFEPDEFSFLAALGACASLACYSIGRGVHCDLIKRGFLPDGYLGSALIDMYAKSAVIYDAEKVFQEIQDKDLIIWNSMISGLAQNGYLDDVLELLCRMREENVQPDNFTFSSVFAACANATAVQQGRQVHALIIKSERDSDTVVANSLIVMYCRAGNILEARNVFSEIPAKNVVSWTTMIGGFVQNGYPQEALEIFHQMEISGVKPNEKTFIALLTACSYAGLSSAAGMYFRMMERKYTISPSFDHYACMVDILGRAGRLQEAEYLIKNMPFEANALVWRMLLSACTIHGDAERGKKAMKKILALDPYDSAAYVLLSNLYASLGNWDGVMEVRQLMKENGVKKEPGKSWIELNQKVHEFLAGDRSHPQTDEIYSKLGGLFKQMKDEGYVPGIQCR